MRHYAAAAALLAGLAAGPAFGAGATLVYLSVSNGLLTVNPLNGKITHCPRPRSQPPVPMCIVIGTVAPSSHLVALVGGGGAYVINELNGRTADCDTSVDAETGVPIGSCYYFDAVAR